MNLRSLLDLKDCPFCGSHFLAAENVVISDDNSDIDGYQVICGYCHAAGPHCKTREEAVLGWNRGIK